MRRILIALISGWVFFFAGRAGAATKLCFKCHDPGAFKGAVRHAPVQQGECTRCHLPHVSRHAHLLRAEVPGLCFECHQELKKKLSAKTWKHLPVERGACERCHQPHAGPKGLLVSQAGKLCFNCHKDLKEKKYRVRHAPFAQGACLKCHEAHGGESRGLLRQEGPALCFGCHRKGEVVSRHGPYARPEMDCLSCHDPHGSGRAHLVKDHLHAPYAQKSCEVCHGSQKAGPEMCFQCHKERRRDFLKIHTHYLPSLKEPFCVKCHSPHASGEKILLRGAPEWVCINCHQEALVQKRESLHIHPGWGRCLDCHEGHGSDFGGLLKGDANAVCVRCHKTQGEFTHPIGEKIRDPRNGQTLTCVTCHDPMGTNFKYELRLSGEAALCLECHKGY